MQSFEARGRSHDKLGFSVRPGAVFSPTQSGVAMCALQDARIVSELANEILKDW